MKPMDLFFGGLIAALRVAEPEIAALPDFPPELKRAVRAFLAEVDRLIAAPAG